MSSKPSMNGVAKRQNHTLQDMVRSMINHSSLLESLWGKVLTTIMCILNRVPVTPGGARDWTKTLYLFFFFFF